MRQKVLLGSFKAIKFPLQSSPRISRAVCSKNSHISSVSSADPYVVHACGYLVAIACRLSPWPTYRPLPCRMPLYPGQLPSFTAFHGPLSRFSGQPLLCPPCRSKASMPSGRLASRFGWDATFSRGRVFAVPHRSQRQYVPLYKLLQVKFCCNT